jgi:hypothetical protein
MKNVFLLPTSAPSKLHFDQSALFVTPKYQLSELINSIVEGRNIYITSDENIQYKDYYLDILTNIVHQATTRPLILGRLCLKIILTTDPILIASKIQSIDDEFLFWFINNPTCEEVETKHIRKEYVDELDAYGYDVNKYKIIIHSKVREGFQKSIDGQQHFIQHFKNGGTVEDFKSLEEPKQETFEEAAENYAMLGSWQCPVSFTEGVKWQAERSYSEEEVKNMLIDMSHYTSVKESRDNFESDYSEWVRKRDWFSNYLIERLKKK